jgi:pyridoxamine 5'-phosphate oxidase
MDEVDLARLRQEYSAAGLDERELPPDPLTLWRRWLRDAQEAALAEVNAMVVTTAGDDGSPSARMVLCKQADPRGFVFFTNYESRKGRELTARPRVSLLFPWHPLGRQVRVEGVAERTPREESEAYFAGRPRGAQISAWASAQSSVVAGRAVLEERIRALEEQYDGRDVPCPPYWGGVVVHPGVVEFWQGRANRLHDRLVYRRDGEGWRTQRLAP